MNINTQLFVDHLFIVFFNNILRNKIIIYFGNNQMDFLYVGSISFKNFQQVEKWGFIQLQTIDTYPGLFVFLYYFYIVIL